jgi:hypothetical protein
VSRVGPMTLFGLAALHHCSGWDVNAGVGSRGSCCNPDFRFMIGATDNGGEYETTLYFGIRSACP